MVISINKLSSINFDKYDVIDSALIPSKDFIRNYGEANDYIEAHLYTKDGRLVKSNYNITDYDVTPDYKPGETNLLNSIILFPERFIESYGFTAGIFDVQYNIFRKKISNVTDKVFFIKEISSDRTEIRLSSNTISDPEIQDGVLNFLHEIESVPYYKDFLLNFGDNKLVNGVNIALDKNTNPYSIVVKLYQPLPAEFQEKSSLWIVEELSESYVFEVELGIENVLEPIPTLRSPNFDINVDAYSIRSSDYVNLNNLYATNSTSSYQKLLNKLNNKSIELSVDYSEYSNFIHFSSAKERLLNFVYKLSSIEDYTSDIQQLATVPNQSSSFSVSSSIYNIQSNLNDVISKFDGYEKYLYYTSASTSWPKSGSYPNYYLYPTTSSIALTWLGSDDSNSNIYGGQLYTASAYDMENQDNLIFSVPEFIVEDDNSESYLLFLNMIGQHFDNIWIYIKSTTDLYKNTNSFTDGISKDLVYSALRSLGIKLYNGNSDQNIFQYLLGSNSSGSYIPSTSSYYTTVSASIYRSSGEDLTKENFKRIYHNLPYLLKSKGTNRGIKALITTFGIPDTILDVTEYGGADKFNNTLEYVYDRFTYAINNTGSSFMETPWSLLRYNRTNNDKFIISPDTIEFRIKPDKNNIKSSVTLFQKNVSSSIATATQLGIVMNYTSSNNIPSATVSFVLSGSAGNVSSSLVVPMYVTGSDGDSLWWNFMLRRRNANVNNDNSVSQYYDLFVKNNISGRVGNQASASLFVTDATYNNSWNYLGSTSSMVYSYLGGTNIYSGPFVASSNFIGQLQEFRTWTENVSESAFNFHVLNPGSIEGNTSSSAYEFLATRFPLGNDLNIYNNSLTSSVHSVHPKYGNRYLRQFQYEYQAGYDSLTSSSYRFVNNTDALFYSGSNDILNFISFPNKNNYSGFNEFYYTNVPNSGYYGAVNDKVRISTKTISGSVLSPMIRQEQPEDYRTKDIHFIDVSFSPQSQLDKDIVQQYGGTVNIDNLIGDPSDDGKHVYPNLIKLRTDYFDKYFDKFNYKDYIRLISFFDNSLFKMIKDYVPARSNLSTGVTIKPSILDRSKIARHQPVVDTTYEELPSEIEGITISAKNTYSSSYGDGRDFFNGELSGSIYDMHGKFDVDNRNPYATYTQNYNQNIFDHSVFNTTLNNISGSRQSTRYMKVDAYDHSILSPAHVQDSNYSLQRHIMPRYVGSKSTSARYNFYTIGDDSYGNNATIDKNVCKFAFLNQANLNNINFWDKTTINIKYLIDATGSITELSRRNFNIFEVQNTFKSGDDVTVSLLDPFNPSNQTELEGNKRIWEGGFSFSPLLFREINETLAFDYITPTSTTTSKLGIKAVMTSSFKWDTTWQLYPNVADGTGTGNFPIFSINGVRQGGKTFGYDLGSTVNNNTWMYESQIPVRVQGPFINSSDPTPQYPGGWDGAESPSYWMSLDCFLANNTSSLNGGYGTADFNGDITTIDNGFERYTYYKAPRSSNYTINFNIPLRITAGDNSGAGISVFKIVAVLEKQVGSSWTYLAHSKLNLVHVPNQFAVNADDSSICNDDYGVDPLRVDCYLNNFNVALNANDRIRTRLYWVEQRRFFTKVTNAIIEVLPGDGNIGNFEMFDSVTSATAPVTSTTIPSDSLSNTLFSLDTGSYDTLIFNDSASLIYNNTRFNTSGSTVSTRYSSITDNFLFMVGDYVRFGTFFKYNTDLFYITKVIEPIVYGSGSISGSLRLVLDRQVSVSSISTQAFAFMRKYPDETSVILDFNKDEGQASSGVLLPYNIKPDIKDNVGNIVGPLKEKLLANVLIL